MEDAVTGKVCAIREKVANRIGSHRFRTWFGEATRFHIEGQRLDVTVNDEFVGNWIASNFMPHLVEVARDVLGAEPRVEIQVQRVAQPDSVPDNGDGFTPVAAGVRVDHGDGAPSLARRAAQSRMPGELDEFVVGPSNELAFSVVSSLVRHPGGSFKHLVLHSGCGLGKTHLLQGICNGLRRLQPAVHWCYNSGEEFTNEFVHAVNSSRIDAFRSRFRSVDVLVIDDIHFLANKRATQQEFLHTFNAIDALGKTIVLSSDAHPRKIDSLSEPLVNRLIAGVVVRIDPPDLATRREILRRRAATMAAEIPLDVLEYLARNITRNVRELEGALYKLGALASLAREPIHLDLARQAIEEYIDSPRVPETTDIERIVAAHFGVTREALRSRSRDRTVTLARGIAMYLARKHTRMSFPEIGRALGSKRHSTILMGVRRIQALIDRNGAVAWKTPAGLREAPICSLLEEVEHSLTAGRDR